LVWVRSLLEGGDTVGTDTDSQGQIEVLQAVASRQIQLTCVYDQGRVPVGVFKNSRGLPIWLSRLMTEVTVRELTSDSGNLHVRFSKSEKTRRMGWWSGSLLLDPRPPTFCMAPSRVSLTVPDTLRYESWESIDVQARGFRISWSLQVLAIPSSLYLILGFPPETEHTKISEVVKRGSVFCIAVTRGDQSGSDVTRVHCLELLKRLRRQARFALKATRRGLGPALCRKPCGSRSATCAACTPP